MEAVPPPPEPEMQAPPAVVATTTTTVVTDDDKPFTTTTTVTVPRTDEAAGGAAALPVPLRRNKTISVDVARAADVNGDAPATPNTMTRLPFETVFDPAEQRGPDVLQEFLTRGGCDCADWDPDGFSQLRNELEKGEATLGLDLEGKVKRVVSVAKPVRAHHHADCTHAIHAPCPDG